MCEYYIAIDLKSFYASVECMERGLDPLKTNLIVADNSRTEKTICLAVSPSLKSYGIPGRARLFEVIQKVKEVNAERRYQIQGRKFNGKSYDDDELKKHKDYEIDYIIAQNDDVRKIISSEREMFSAKKKPPAGASKLLRAVVPDMVYTRPFSPFFLASSLAACRRSFEYGAVRRTAKRLRSISKVSPPCSSSSVCLHRSGCFAAYCASRFLSAVLCV